VYPPSFEALLLQSSCEKFEVQRGILGVKGLKGISISLMMSLNGT